MMADTVVTILPGRKSLSHSGVPMTLILLFFLLSLTIAFAITFYVYLQKNEEAHTQIRKLRHEYRKDKLKWELERDSSHAASTGYRFASVLAGPPPCSEIGLDILVRQGGSSVDAVIAGLVCAGVVHNQLSGLGGGLIMTVYDRTHNDTTRQVKTLIATDYPEDDKDTDSHRPIPGELWGYHSAWKRYGVLPWHRLFEPSIRLCEEGFTVTPLLARDINYHEQYLNNSQTTRDRYFRNGSGLKAGTIQTLPALAKTLRIIAENGAEVFYNGTLKRDVIKDMKECDVFGSVTFQDFKNYSGRWEDPYSVELENAGYKIYTPRSPSTGVAVVAAMVTLDEYNMTSQSLQTDASLAQLYQRITGIMKRVKEHLADIVISQWKLGASKMKIALMRSLHDDIHLHKYYVNRSSASTTPVLEDAHGQSVVVLAPDGSAVSAASTLRTRFGAGCIGPRTGILFGGNKVHMVRPVQEKHAAIPFINLSPTIVTKLKDNTPHVLLSTTEGKNTAYTSVELLVKLLLMGKSLRVKDQHPKLRVDFEKDIVEYEDGFPRAVLNKLEELGYAVRKLSSEDALRSTTAVYNKCVNKDGHTHEKQRCIESTCESHKTVDSCSVDGV